MLSGINRYLQSNKTKFIEQLGILQGGTASFSSLNINIWRQFPSVLITMDNFLLHDSLYYDHNIPLVQLGSLRANFSLPSFIRDSIELQSIRLYDGEINFFTDSSGYSNARSIFSSNRNNSYTDKTHVDNSLISTHGMNLSLSNIEVSFIKKPTYKQMVGTIDDMHIHVVSKGDIIVLQTDLDVEIDELSFNTTKGSFLQQSRISGHWEAQIDNGTVSIPIAPIQINDQLFEIGAEFFGRNPIEFQLFINNSSTDFSKTMPLMDSTIQAEVKDYQILGSFSTQSVVAGTFAYRALPYVTIDFTMDDQTVKAGDLTFKHFSTHGQLVYSPKEDTTNLIGGRGKAHMEFQQLATYYEDFNIQTDTLFLGFNNLDVEIRTQLQIDGHAQSISEWFESKEFMFDQGNFTLTADINGFASDPEKILVSSYADLQFKDIDVIYKPANVLFPFDRILLEKQAGNANFSLISSRLSAGHEINLNGQLRNFPSLLLDDYNLRTSSNVNLRMTKVTWNEFLDYFGTNGYFNTEEKKNRDEKKKSLKETMQGLYQYFKPEINAAIDTLEYLDKLTFTDFSTGFHFVDEHTLVLEKTTFFNNKSSVSLSASLDFQDPNLTPFELQLHTEHLNLQELLPRLDYLDIKLLSALESLPTDMNLYIEHSGVLIDTAGLLQEYNQGKITFNDGKEGRISGTINYTPSPNGLNTDIQIIGKPELINQFFHSDEFLFQGGLFEVNFNYTADVDKFDQVRLIQEAEAILSVTNSEIYYQPVDVIFPLKEMRVHAQQNNADFKVRLQNDSTDSELWLQGKLKNLHAFLSETYEEDPFRVIAEIYSPKLYWNDLQLFTQAKETKAVSSPKGDNIRETVRSILNTYQPNVTVKLDTFVYSDQLVVQDLRTGMLLRDSSLLELEETGFTFHNGSMVMDAQIDLTSGSLLPFQVNMQTENLDVGSLMEKLNYLDVKALQETDKLEGQLSMMLDLKGTLDLKRQMLISEHTYGTLGFELRNIQLRGLKALDAFATKIHKKRRFADLSLAPITNTITIKGNTLSIPLTEIQSNAIQLFLEGEYRVNDSSNIWISIPLHNLKKPNLDEVPERTGYALAGDKVYVEISTSDDEKSRVKFRTSKRKFYEKRGILPRFKQDKRLIRRLRQVERQQRQY